MAAMKAKFSFGKKKQHDEEEEVEEAHPEADEKEPAGPSTSLETREQASHKTPAKSPPLAGAAIDHKKSHRPCPRGRRRRRKLMCRLP